MAESKTALTAEAIVKELKKCGITHVIWLPDSRTRFLDEALEGEPEFSLIPVCREGEAAAIAAGLILGGKNPVIMHQNTGFFESGDSIRCLALGYHLPMLFLMGLKGWRGGAPMTESAGVFTSPILEAWGIEGHLLTTDEDVGIISRSYREARETGKPVAILIARESEKK